MATKSKTVAHHGGVPTTALTVFIVRTAPGQWVGSPSDARVKNRNLAACWRDESEALAFCRTLDVGQVEAFTPRVVGPLSDDAVTTATPAKAVVTKAPRGPAREDVVAVLRDAGLHLIAKSSDHWVHPDDTTGRGPRLVLPKAAETTRLFLYACEARSLPGYRTPEQRKAEGLGKVTVVLDVADIEGARKAVAALCEVLGIRLRQDGRQRASRSRRSTPMGGSKQVSEGTSYPLREVMSGPVDEVQAGDGDVTQNTSEATDP